ncbi:Outer membrane porin protein 32 [Pandoraea iniqua]|uniref:porin n=1 Tax=Pandoraea iniqua TaxID=2508288 RepID=UPI00123EF340|nr:porin [Pandoraea iniqua]VVD67655.1 Outer membrane porin protein 32 [Pandoraea iniqua]
MKHHFCRLGVAVGTLAALTSGAHAQSNVTLYGIVDLGIEALTNVPGANGSKTTLVRETSGNMAGSRWGIRGTEDLGGGYKAIFVLENGFSANTGVSGQSGREFGRKSFVGLSGAFGTVMLGRQQNLLYDISIRYDPMFYAASYSAYSHDPYLAARTDNTVKYTGKFGGLTFSTMYSSGYDSTIPSGAQVPGHSKVGRDMGAGVMYQSGPLDVGLVYDQRQGTSIDSADDTARRVIVGIAYKLTSTDLYAAYRYLQQTVGSTQTHTHLYWAGVTQHFSPALTLSGAVYHTDVVGSNQDPTSFVLALGYYLSKRTDLYWNMSYALNRNGSNLGVGGMGVNVIAGQNQFGTVAGVRHRF